MTESIGSTSKLSDSPPPASGKVIAFASAKGGTGKTVLAASTALVLIRSGKRVLLIDGDFSTRGLSLFILGNILHTTDLVIRDEECVAELFLSATGVEGATPRRIDRNGVEYHILFSNRTLWQSGVPEQTILSEGGLEPRRYIDGIVRLLAHFRSKYDYILIDTRGGYDSTSAIPALLSDTHIIVLEPDRVSLEQINGYEKAMNEFASKHGIQIQRRGLLVNKASFDPAETQFVEELTRTYQVRTYGVIPADISCIRAYEITDSPILRFSHGDFAYWCIVAIEKFVNPKENWSDRAQVKKFEKQRNQIGSAWADRKRADKFLAWVPLASLVPIIVGSLFLLIFKYFPSAFWLRGAYWSVVVFVVLSMISSTFWGVERLRWRGVPAFMQRSVFFVAASVLLFAATLFFLRSELVLFVGSGGHCSKCFRGRFYIAARSGAGG
jgi:cellulose biosynthesis protein BcsQ